LLEKTPPSHTENQIGESSRAISISSTAQEANITTNTESSEPVGERVEITEVEAVVSCTSDGLVVILRRARPLIPKPLHDMPEGVFASPWAPVPLVPPVGGTSVRGRPNDAAFMEAIREVAVFAWSLRELGGEVVVPENEAESSAKTNSVKESKQ